MSSLLLVLLLFVPLTTGAISHTYSSGTGKVETSLRVLVSTTLMVLAGHWGSSDTEDTQTLQGVTRTEVTFRSTPTGKRRTLRRGR